MSYKYSESVRKLQKFWWQESGDNVQDAVFNTVTALRDVQGYRKLANVRHMSLYGNYNMAGLGGSEYAKPVSGDQLTLNVIRSVIDTVVSKITKNPPRATVLPLEGDWSLRNKGKRLTQYAQGVFYELDLYRKGEMAFRDACIFDDGHLKFFIENNKIQCDRIFGDEILVDDREAAYGYPRQLFIERGMAQEVMLEKWPHKRNKIKEAEEVAGYKDEAESAVTLQKRIIECYHLPSGPEATDGRHVICIDNATMLDERWDKPYFPLVQTVWAHRPKGYRGRGITEELAPIQVEINVTLEKIQRSLALAAPHVFVPRGANIVQAHLTNEEWSIIEYDGPAGPQFAPTSSIPPDLYNHLQDLYQKAFEQVGISQMSAQSQKPSGLDAAVALREFHDIESERFMEVSKNYERFYMDCTDQIYDLSRELYAKGVNTNVKARKKRFIESIDWRDVDMKEDEYQLQVFPTSFLPATPAGKLQTISEMMRMGLLSSKEEALALLDVPDLDRVQSLSNAAWDDIELHLERIIDHQDYHPPVPLMNLELGVKLGQAQYLRSRIDGAPEEVLDLLLRFVDECQALMRRAAEEAMAQQQAAAMPPVGQPGPAAGAPAPQAPPPDVGASPPPAAGPPPPATTAPIQ
jgi:hypothetical protein